MKILLDKNLPTKIQYDFGEGHEVRTEKDMNWLGKKNGELLGLAAFNGFDLLITLDRNLKNRQNLNKVELLFIVLLNKVKALLQSGKDLPKLSEISID